MPRQNQTSKGSGRGRSTRGRSQRESIFENPLDIDLRRFNGGGVNKVIRSVYRSPLVITFASGVGVYFIGRFLMNYYKDHPEIGEFFRENFDTLEERLRDFRGAWSSADQDLARH